MSGDPDTIRNLDNNFDPSASTATPDDNLDGLKNNPDNIDGELDDVLSKYSDYIKNETLSLDIIKTDLDSEEVDINGRNIKFKVEKVK